MKSKKILSCTTCGLMINDVFDKTWIKGAYQRGYGTWCSEACELVSEVKENPLDPLFWQALGKALGWPKWTYYERGKWHTTEDDAIQFQSRTPFVYLTYVHKQVGFILALNEGKENKFWKDLIN